MTVTSKGFAGSLRSATPAAHSRITGIGGYRPRRIVPNSREPTGDRAVTPATGR